MSQPCPCGNQPLPGSQFCSQGCAEKIVALLMKLIRTAQAHQPLPTAVLDKFAESLIEEILDAKAPGG